MKKIKSNEEIINIFLKKYWQNDANKNLLYLIKDKRMKMHPSTLYKLDRIGFNKLQIMAIDPLIGKIIQNLPPADCEFLNNMQGIYDIVFNYEQKKKNRIRIKLSNFVYDYNESTKRYNGESGLFLQA
tara:strand:+ start:194 stop:577 length:384 start_codon:yes stop_codon:yes gene_type:complete